MRGWRLAVRGVQPPWPPPDPGGHVRVIPRGGGGRIRVSPTPLQPASGVPMASAPAMAGHAFDARAEEALGVGRRGRRRGLETWALRADARIASACLIVDFRQGCKPLLARRARGWGCHPEKISLSRVSDRQSTLGLVMTGEELRRARKALGDLWRLGRPVHAAELGRALRMAPSDPGESIRLYEARRQDRVPGPVAVAVEMMLAGMQPPDGLPERRKDR